MIWDEGIFLIFVERNFESKTSGKPGKEASEFGIPFPNPQINPKFPLSESRRTRFLNFLKRDFWFPKKVNPPPWTVRVRRTGWEKIRAKNEGWCEREPVNEDVEEILRKNNKSCGTFI